MFTMRLVPLQGRDATEFRSRINGTPTFKSSLWRGTPDVRRSRRVPRMLRNSTGYCTPWYCSRTVLIYRYDIASPGVFDNNALLMAFTVSLFGVSCSCT